MANCNSSNYSKQASFKDQILKTGWILKKSKHIKNYRKRWMSLQGYKLFCYKTKKFRETKESPTEVFDLALHRYRVDKHNTVKQKFYLIDETMRNSRTFKAFSELDRNEWVYKITDSITISREISFDTLYLKISDKAPGPKTRAIGLSLSATATFESEIASKSIQDLHDSESEQSDNDFNEHEDIVHVSILQNGQNIQTRKRRISKRKQHIQITLDSFQNFRVEPLSIDADIPDFSDESDESDDDESKLNPLLEENEDFADDQSEEEDEDEVDDDAIIEQLIVFGYDRKDILNAMQNVIDSKNINEITDKLDEQITNNCNFTNINTNTIFIQQQIIGTEQTYFEGVDTLLNELIQPIFDNNFVDKKYYHQIRSSLPKIFEFHRSFLKEMNEVFNKNKNSGNYKTVINVFNEYIMQNKQQFIDINIKYICDYQRICNLFGFTFHGNVKLDEFLKEKRREMKPLSSLLILPVQRIPRYIYLLKHLKQSIAMDVDEKSNDSADINDAIEMMKGITKEINERKENIENLAQCLQIQQGLNGLKQPIVRAERRFIQQFIFIKKSIKHQRLFFLFNDIIVIANEKWNVKHILQVCSLDVKIEIVDKNKKGRDILPEFTLVSTGCGSAVYIGQDMKTINKFKKLIGKWRVQIMSDELRERNNTLGSLKKELGRQALLYD